MSQSHPAQLFHLPLLVLAYTQLQNLNNAMKNLSLTGNKEICGYNWGSITFVATKAYKKLIGHHQVQIAFT
jgi:hypothetical protein